MSRGVNVKVCLAKVFSCFGLFVCMLVAFFLSGHNASVAATLTPPHISVLQNENNIELTQFQLADVDGRFHRAQDVFSAATFDDVISDVNQLSGSSGLDNINNNDTATPNGNAYSVEQESWLEKVIIFLEQ